MGAGTGKKRRVRRVDSFSVGRQAFLPKGFHVVAERILRHTDPNENRDREYRVLFIYNNKNDALKMQRYWGRWGQGLQTMHGKEVESGTLKGTWGMVQRANKLLGAKQRKGYASQQQGAALLTFNQEEILKNVQERRFSDSNPVNTEVVQARIDEEPEPIF